MGRGSDMGTIISFPVKERPRAVAAAAQAGDRPSAAVIILPVIVSLCNGNCSLTVVGFALFWLDGYSAGACTGNSCLIQGRFVSSELTVNAVAGVFDPNSLIHFTRLSE